MDKLKNECYKCNVKEDPAKIKITYLCNERWKTIHL